MADRFSQLTTMLDSPASSSFAITPTANANAEFVHVTRYVYVGMTGNVTVKLAGDSAHQTFYNVPQGTVLPIRAIAISNTSTANALIGLY